MTRTFLARKPLFPPLSAGLLGAALLLGGCPPGAEKSNPGDLLNTVLETPAADEDTRARPLDLTIRPNVGPLDGGTVVTMIGRGFTPDTSVQFGGLAAAEVTVVNEKLLTAVAPPGVDAVAVEILVQVPPTGGPQAAWPVPQRAQFTYYILPPDDGTDSDGDGLTDYQELVGWEIWVDWFGLQIGVDTFGNVTRYTTFSDPNKVDTDGDGLRDRDEFLARTDAQKIDTDGDDLSDFEEIVRFHTNATHVDSDHDSRGPDGNNPPNVKLFDGAELKTAGFVKPEKLFFAEYVEGAGNDRALEIYNPTDDAVDLAAGGYQVVVREPQGQTLATIPLTGMAPARGTFVLADPQANPDILGRANQTAALPFDGRQIVELTQGSERGDVIGSETAVFGPDAADQQQTQGTLWRGWWEGTAEQTFTVGSTGRLTSIELKLRSSYTPDNMFAVLRDGQVIAFQYFEVPGPTGDEGVVFNMTLFDKPLVQAGEVLTFQVLPIDSFEIAYATGNPYAGGAAANAPDEDYFFVTHVEPLMPWGDASHSTRDHVLRRKFEVCEPDASASDAFDPATGWDAYPSGMTENLGRHEAACVPVRIITGGTSPSLADTDGDGATDWEELDTPARNPLIAEVPEVELKVVDNIDVRLFVEYADSIGTSTEYSQSFSQGQSRTTGSSHTTSISDSIAVSTELELQIGDEDTHIRGQIGFEYAHDWGQEWTDSSESTVESQKEYAQAQAESRERQENASKGEISTGIIIRNNGKIAYTLSNLAITMRQYVPDFARRGPDNPRVMTSRTIGTLLPHIDSVSLAPGESTAVLQMADEEVNPQIVREYLANPTGLFLEPAAFQLENAEGLNFAFLQEVTRARTALVSIDYTDANVPFERYYVATNVDRNADGSFAGVPLRTVLEQIIGLPRKEAGDANLGNGYVVARGAAGGPLRLKQMRGLGPDTVPGSKWYVIGTADGIFEDRDGDGSNDLDFDAIVLHAGDAVRLMLSRDDDGDGLVNLEEAYHGTGDTPGSSDTDGDGLDDKDEINGWTITVGGVTRYVASDPRVPDADLDGLTDAEEFAAKTNPRAADTDNDGLNDAIDPHPTDPAIRFYVDAAIATAGDGTTWDHAFKTIEAALDAAEARNTNGSSTDDVSEVWVARGTYLPAYRIEGPITMLPNVAIYGGFQGGETQLAQRDPNPYTNETVISGNIGDPNNFADNLHNIVYAHNVGAAAVLDGFTIANAYVDFNDPGDGAVNVAGPVTLRNLLLLNNDSVEKTIVTGALQASGDSYEKIGPVLINVHFVQNRALVGAGLFVQHGYVRLERCQFISNSTLLLSPVWGGAGMFVNSGSSAELFDCVFDRNDSTIYQDGGGLYIRPNGRVTMDRCRFQFNNTIAELAGPVESSGGGIFSEGTLIARNCTFYGNGAYRDGGGGIYALNGQMTELYNCSFSQNVSGNTRATTAPGAGGLVSHRSTTSLQNCIFVDNFAYSPATGKYESGMYQQLNIDPDPSTLDSGLLLRNVRSSLVATPLGNEKNYIFGNGNVFTAPGSKVFIPGPTLRLQNGSPAIDAGFNFFDADPDAPGIQFLGALDAGSQPRITDGDGDGEAIIDIGAHEFSSSP